MNAFSRFLGKTHKNQQPPATGQAAPSTATTATSTITAAATPTRATRSSTATKEGSTLADRAAELVPGADQTTTTTTKATSKKRPFADTLDASTLAPSQSSSRTSLSSRSATLPRSSSSSLSSAAQSPEPSSSASETPTTPSDFNYQPFGCGPGTSLISESRVKPIVIATSPSPPPPSPPAPKGSIAPTHPPTEAIPVPGVAGQSPNALVAAALAASSSSIFADRYHPRHDRFALAEDQDFSARLNHLDEDVEMTSGSMMDAMHFGGDRSRQESFGGSKPISMMNNPHRDASGVRFRESLTGSHIAGTSISLSRTPFLGSSWVRDNVLPSSFTQHQSPSNHSSSYQPKLEANYLSNFLCCGKEIRNLHDLLQHYEDTHAGAAVNGFSQLNGFQPQQPRSRPTPSGLAPSDQFVGQSHLSPNHGLHPFSAAQQQQQQQQRSTSHISRDQRHLAMTANMDDMDTVGEMDMDDAVGHMELDDGMSGQRRARQIFGQQQNRSSLSINGPSGLSQALRGSQPPTPGAPNFGLQHDPTVASVNTPTLSTQAQQQHQAQQQQLDQAFMQEAVANMGHNGAGAFGGMGLGNGFGNGIANFGNLNFAATALNNSSDFCINDPAKALFSPGNPHPNNNGNLFGDTPAGRNLQHQLMQSMNLSVQGLQSHPQKALLQQLGPMMLRDEDKPHKCPVVGCDKAYKNSNGLKYHKSHGHLNQQLHDNGDGTFSIINPETSTPYPGTEGMEKEKPFSCELCNKRYKNPNGLKYHRLHSDCNPELRIKKLQELQAAGLPAAMNLFPDGLVEGMPNGMVNGLDGGMGGGLDGGLASGLHTPMTEHMDDMDMSDIIAG